MGVEDVNRRIEIAEEGLNKGNMYLKEWAVTGVNGHEIEFGSNDTGALGLFWDPKKDVMKIKLRVNLGGKKRNLRDEDSALTTHKEVNDYLDKNKITKRVLLRIVMSNFDPHNLLLPLHSELKDLYRSVIENNPGLRWDEAIDQNYIPRVKRVLRGILDLGEVSIPRYLRLHFPPGGATLVTFTDGGLMGATQRSFLISSPLPDGRHEVHMIGNSHKILREEQGSAPKAEVTGFLMGSRAQTGHCLT